MSHVLRLAFVLCLATHVAFAAKPDPMDASAAGDGPSRLPSVLSSTYPYYQTIRTYSFDNAGVPNAQGWATHDLTAQYGTFWHVDDFAGLSGYAPLQGTKSMWCGVRPGVVTDPAIPNAPGFGDNWTQILRFPNITNPFGAGRSLGLNVRMSYDMPDTYDRMDIEYRSPAGTGSWNLLGTFTGTAGSADQGFQFVAAGSTIELRFVMTSDGSESDETFGFDSHGAVVLDNIILGDNPTATVFYTQNFESYAVGTTNGGSWVAETPPAFGNYAGLVSGSSVYQDGTPNTTGMWSFFNGSTATYACGGHPSQLATPYTQVPGSTRPGDYLLGEVRSPLIDFTVDQNNQPSDPGMGTLAMEFDMYRTTSNFVLPGYRWRFVVNGVLQEWQGGTSFLTLSPSWFSMNTIKFNGGAPIPPGATQVQFSLLAMDVEFGGGGTCHTQAPLFDNVRIIRMYNPVRVANTNNSGVGSMRQAMIDANSNPDMNAMLFFLGNNGPYTINLASPLPAITGPLWIDGFSQAGSLPNTSQLGSTSAQLKVAVNGAGAGPGANGLLFAAGSYGVARGLAIGGFSGAGIRDECTSLIATGCYVGLDPAGTTPAPNGIGILDVTQGMDIGGPLNEERMLVSANTGDGIRVVQGGTHILNSHIGYGADASGLVNGEAIHVMGGTSCQIGEPTVNPCDGESTDRVWILGGNIEVETPASGVSISQVVIEYGLIDLGINGPTANDPLDADSGANGLLNFPVLTSAGATTIVGNMDGLPNQTHRIEFFTGDGFQTASKYLGYQSVTTDGSGHAAISFSCGAIPPGSNITATATAGLNTSEFGPWITFDNTPPGAPSPLIQLYDNSSVLRASVQFDNVVSGGNTFLNPTTPPAAPNPQTWNVGQTPLYWDIATNASSNGYVHIRLYYDPANIPGPENTLRLLHFENSQWVDVTDSFDFAANWIGGTVLSLSPFVLAIHTGATGVGDAPAPDQFALRPNVPNPFNPATTIDYDVRRGGADVSITIFDVAGRLVRTLVDEHRAAGHYRVQWNGLDDSGRPVSSGVYFYRMQAPSFTETRKMVLLK